MSLRTNVKIGDVAHGGTCIAHVDGKATFVRGALPGEIVDLEITEATAKIARAKVVSVVSASSQRVIPECEVAGVCGGCDWLHTSFSYSRELKRRVVAEALRRFAGIEWDGVVTEVAPDIGWRTRMSYQESAGVIGLYAHRSHQVIGLPDNGCLAAAPEISRPLVSGLMRLSADGLHCGPGLVEERAVGRIWQVSGFWQVHPKAADTLASAVASGLAPRVGETALDLFCGVGLFASVLTDAGCSTTGVEGSKTAVTEAMVNVPNARFIAGDVFQVLNRNRFRADLVVLDPPRAGAKAKVMAEIMRIRPRAIAYVACDPVALARDLNYLSGYRIDSITAFDLFPGTQHVETVVLLSRVKD